MRRFLGGLILVSSGLVCSVDTSGQTGPVIDCIGCDEFLVRSYPETGAWFNPHESGSGFTFEVQDGHLVGYYYGYDADGLPEWYIFSGPLLETSADALYTYEGVLYRLSGGNCLGCVYVPPTANEFGTIRIAFLQRNYARFSVNDGPEQFIVPITFGVPGQMAFEEYAEYAIPHLEGQWVLVLEDPEFGPMWGRSAIAVTITNQSIRVASDGNRYLSADFFRFVPPIEVVGIGHLDCIQEPVDEDPESFGPPACSIRLSLGGGQIYDFNLPLAHIGDARFEAEALDGRRLQAYRLDYD